MFGIVAIVLFVVVLGGIVLVHELGHYLTAKALNVRVLEFGIGFPPRAKVLRSKGETLWTLNWLPIGGFVRLEGEDGDAADDPRSFAAQPLRARLAILVAGVVMNIVLAFVDLLPHRAPGDARARASRSAGVEPDSPAASAGLVAGDEIYAVDGEQFDLFGGADRAGCAPGTRRPDGPARGSPRGRRDDHGRAPRSGPKAELSDDARGARRRPARADVPRTPATTSARRSGSPVCELGRWGGLILGGLGELIGGLVTNPTAPPPASGPIGIAVSLADIFLNVGPIVTLYVAGILSVNLGVVNILPFPPLDGGRVRVLVIKRLFGSAREPARRAADLRRRLRVPARVHPLDLGLRHRPPRRSHAMSDGPRRKHRLGRRRRGPGRSRRTPSSSSR